MPESIAQRTPEPPVALSDLGGQLLQEAREGSNGHAAITLTPGADGFTQTLVALSEGTALDPEHWNGPASVLVIEGRVRLSSTDQVVEPGCWAPLPDDHSDVLADADTTVLLSVATTH